MNDYKELIEELRNIEFVGDAPYGKHWGVLVDILTVKQAADAIEQLVKERDAAVEDLFDMTDYYGDNCHYCAKGKDKPCAKCEWEWRGVTK